MVHKGFLLGIFFSLFFVSIPVEGSPIGNGKIKIDYLREILFYDGIPKDFVECSAMRSPFVAVSLKSLIGNITQTIYCRLSCTPSEIVEFILPGRPEATLHIDYSNVCLVGDTLELEWRYKEKQHSIEKVSIPDSILRIVSQYPGLVADSEVRLAEVKVELNGVFDTMHPASRLSLTSYRPWFGTGLYAPPGEVITIRIPTSLRNTKIKCRIGTSSSTLTEKQKPWKRLPTTYVVRELNTASTDTTRIYNVNGGHIYIIPEKTFSHAECFVISGAVNAPDFVMGKTDPQVWRDAIQSSGVPYAELIGKRWIWTMPTAVLKTCDDPEKLTAFYDDLIEYDFNGFHGLSDMAEDPRHRSPSFASRCMQDIQIHAGAAYAGYPNMFNSPRTSGDMTYAKRAVKLDVMAVAGNAWGAYHEVGHTYQTLWKWMDGPGSIGEVSNNLHVIHSQNRLFQRWHAGTVPEGSTKGYQYYINKMQGIPIVDRNFESDAQTDGTGRLVSFCQLAQKFGWKLYAYIGKCVRELPEKYASVIGGSPTSGRREFFCKRVCEYAGADMRPFFDFWGIKYGPLAAADMATLPKYVGEEFWLTWDVNKLGDLVIEKNPLVKLPDNNYDMKEGEVNREKWEPLMDQCVHAGTEENILRLFDGGGNTTWGSLSVNRPVYNIQPIVVVDMGTSETFDYVEFKHGGNGYARQNCKKFRLDVKDLEQENWQLAGEFTNTEGLNDFKRHVLSSFVSARYLRITFLEGFPEGAPNQGSIIVAEFKIGKKP